MKKFLNNIWTITIVGGLIVGFIILAATPSVLSFLSEKDVFLLLLEFFTWVYRLIQDALLFEIKLYVIIILAVLLFVIRKVSNSIRNNSYPKFLSYTSDKFGDLNFKWEYEKNYDGKYAIINLRPVCSCECELTEDYNMLKCPNCQNIFPGVDYDGIRDINKIIRHRINEKLDFK